MTKRSEKIDTFAAALAKAQAEIRPAEKNATNPHFDSNYADLASVWDACRAPLTANGFSVVQTMEEENGRQYLETLLLHASGEWIAGRVPLILQRQDMQGIGSAITYARRYGLAAAAGVAQEDDDGNNAGQAKQGAQRRGQGDNPDTSRPAPNSKPKPQPGPESAEMEKLRADIDTQLVRLGWPVEKTAAFVKEKYKVDRGSDMSLGQLKNMLKALDATKAETKDQPRHEAEGEFATGNPELKR